MKANQPVSKPHLYLSILLLYVLSAAAFGLAAFLLVTLLDARDAAFGVLDQVVTITDEIQEQVIVVPVHIEQAFPINADVPLDYHERISVTVNVPISTVLTTPVEISGQTVMLQIPVNAVVPTQVDVPISVSKTLAISTTIPVQLDASVAVRLADTPLPGYLVQLRAAVEGIK